MSALAERLTPEQRAAAVEALAVLRRSAAVWGHRAALSHVHAARGVLWDAVRGSVGERTTATCAARTLPARAASGTEMKDVSIGANDLRTLLICSMRYALGRSTYMPGMVQGLIRQHATLFSERDRQQLAEEICQHGDMYGGKIGMDVDTAQWLRFRDWLLLPASDNEART